jgi:hypothetical protein
VTAEVHPFCFLCFLQEFSQPPLCPNANLGGINLKLLVRRLLCIFLGSGVILPSLRPSVTLPFRIINLRFLLCWGSQTRVWRFSTLTAPAIYAPPVKVKNHHL